MSNVCAMTGEFGGGSTVDMGEQLYRRVGRTAIAEIPPDQCHAGHLLRYPNVLVGWDGIGRTYTCWTCYRAGTTPHTLRYQSGD
jgi:hypothetical protein